MRDISRATNVSLAGLYHYCKSKEELLFLIQDNCFGRVLERLEERLENVRTSTQRGRERADSYTLELQRHGLESVEREVRWLTELIDRERSGGYGEPADEREAGKID